MKNEGIVGIEKIEGLIEKFTQFLVQIENQHIQIFNSDFPDTIDFKGVKPIANWAKYFYFIFLIPSVVLFIYSQDILKYIAKLLHISHSSSNAVILGVFLFTNIVVYGTIVALYLLFDHFTKKHNILEINENHLKFKNKIIKIDNIFKCFQNKFRKNIITIYYKDKNMFKDLTYRLRNPAEAYAVCSKLRELKIKRHMTTE